MKPSKAFDVVSICNALVDILVVATDDDLNELELTKGVMHLVDGPRQSRVLERFQSHEKTTELGGSSMNAIRTLTQLGAKTSFIGAIGQDTFGQLIRDRMDLLGIHPHLKSCDIATGTCLILITPDGERTMNTNLGASCLLDPSMIPTDILTQSKIFHFCGYQWDTEPQIKTIQNAIALTKKAGGLISFDVADPFVVNRHKQDFLQLIADSADIVFANKEEARMLFDCGPDQAARKIADRGALAVIKKGAEGAVIAAPDLSQLIVIRPVKAEVIDTTAAGDMFAAGFLYGFANDKDLETCGQAAATIASDVICRIGATVSEVALSQTKQVVGIL